MAEDYTDLLTQQAALARRQKLLDALQGQNQAMPIQANNWTQRIVQAISKLGGGALAGQQQEKLAADQSIQQQQYGKALTGSMTDFMGKMQGTPAVDPVQSQGNLMEGDPNQIVQPGRAAVAPDPRAAVIAALSSRLPEMQTLGKEGLGALAKQDTPKYGSTAQTGLNPATGKYEQYVIDENSGRQRWLGSGPKMDIVALRENGGAINASTGEMVVKPTVREAGPITMGSALGFGGENAKLGFQQDKDGRWHPVDTTPRTSVSTHVGGPVVQMGAGIKAGYEAAFKKNADTVSELGDKARVAAAQNSTLAQMNTLSDGGTYTGPTSQGALKLGQLASSLGMNVDQSTLTNSQTYNALATRVWQQAISAAGGNKGITAAEAEQLRTLSPELAQTPGGRKQITSVLKSINDRHIGDFRKANSSYNESLKNQDPTLFDLGPTMLPDTSQVPLVPPATRTPPAGWSVVKQ